MVRELADKRYAYEVDATEVGDSLKCASATVTKATHETTSGAGSGSADR